jgi:hypothetical protein
VSGLFVKKEGIERPRSKDKKDYKTKTSLGRKEGMIDQNQKTTQTKQTKQTKRHKKSLCQKDKKISLSKTKE